jgi:hypothetical protein
MRTASRLLALIAGAALLLGGNVIRARPGPGSPACSANTCCGTIADPCPCGDACQCATPQQPPFPPPQEHRFPDLLPAGREDQARAAGRQEPRVRTPWVPHHSDRVARHVELRVFRI